MTILQRYNHLKKKHLTLDREVDEAVKRPWADMEALRRLKRRRLRVRDELASLERLLAAVRYQPAGT